MTVFRPAVIRPGGYQGNEGPYTGLSNEMQIYLYVLWCHQGYLFTGAARSAAGIFSFRRWHKICNLN